MQARNIQTCVLNLTPESRQFFASGAAADMEPVWNAAALRLPTGVLSTNLSYGRLLASLWPRVRDNGLIRASLKGDGKNEVRDEN